MVKNGDWCQADWAEIPSKFDLIPYGVTEPFWIVAAGLRLLKSMFEERRFDAMIQLAERRASGVRYDNARLERLERSWTDFQELDRLMIMQSERHFYCGELFARVAFTPVLSLTTTSPTLAHALASDLCQAREWIMRRANKWPDSAALRYVTNEVTAMLNCVFRDPDAPQQWFDYRWRTSNVVDLASAIHANKTYQYMPILGDALKDSGCDDDAILGHCAKTRPMCFACLGRGCKNYGPDRGGCCNNDGYLPIDPHIPGCWVLDAILEKRPWLRDERATG